MKVFGLDAQMRPLKKEVKNDFEVKREVIIDHATDLMWQKAGSSKELTHYDALLYVKQLNQNRFAGFSDWRLPTVEELLSLMDSTKQLNGMYITGRFDSQQKWCSSADTKSPGVGWTVFFHVNKVSFHESDSTYFVRAVRSLQP